MAASAPDPSPLQAFQAALVTRHPLTQRAYLGTLRDFLAWLAMQPGGHPFRFEVLTQTALFLHFCRFPTRYLALPPRNGVFRPSGANSSVGNSVLHEQ